MGLKIKIGKADYEALDDSLKTLYVADGDNFKLDADYEDVTGLKAKAAELLAEQKRLKDQMRQFDGLDPEAARAAIAAAAKAEQEKLTAAGDIDKIKEQLVARHQSELEAKAAEVQAATDRANAIVESLRREKIAHLAIARGVKPDMVEGAIAQGRFDQLLDLNEADFSLHKRDGIGDAKEIDDIFNNFKTKSPSYFLADNVAGSGASGSNGQSGNGSIPKTATRAEIAAMAPAAKREFYLNDGEPSD